MSSWLAPGSTPTPMPQYIMQMNKPNGVAPSQATCLSPIEPPMKTKGPDPPQILKFVSPQNLCTVLQFLKITGSIRPLPVVRSLVSKPGSTWVYASLDLPETRILPLNPVPLARTLLSDHSHHVCLLFWPSSYFGSMSILRLLLGPCASIYSLWSSTWYSLTTKHCWENIFITWRRPLFFLDTVLWPTLWISKSLFDFTFLWIHGVSHYSFHARC